MAQQGRSDKLALTWLICQATCFGSETIFCAAKGEVSLKNIPLLQTGRDAVSQRQGQAL